MGNRAAIDKLGEWLEAWSRGRPAKTAVLLHGPPGVGKTVVSEALANERGWDLVEINASDKRSGEVLSRIAGMASTQTTLGGKGRLILVDEVDGINLREDSGAITATVQIIRNTRFPIVITANDPWDPKIRPLRDACLVLELKRLGARDVLPFLKTILSKESVRVEEEALRFLLEKNSGDIRSTLNDLQVLAGNRKAVGMREVEWLSWRDRSEKIFEVLRLVFNSKTVAAARKASSLSEVDHEMLFQWIFENAPYQIPNPVELLDAVSALAEADMFYARIRRTQDWHLLSYALDLMTAGVAMAKKTPTGGFVPMKFPQKISSMSRTRAARELRKSVGLTIGSECHLSSRRAVQLYLPMIQFIHEHNRSNYEQIAEWLGADEQLNEILASS